MQKITDAIPHGSPEVIILNIGISPMRYKKRFWVENMDTGEGTEVSETVLRRELHAMFNKIM